MTISRVFQIKVSLSTFRIWEIQEVGNKNCVFQESGKFKLIKLNILINKGRNWLKLVYNF